MLERADRRHPLPEPVSFAGIEELPKDLAAARLRRGRSLHVACVQHHFVTEFIDVVHPIDLRHLHLDEPLAQLGIV